MQMSFIYEIYIFLLQIKKENDTNITIKQRVYKIQL